LESPRIHFGVTSRFADVVGAEGWSHFGRFRSVFFLTQLTTTFRRGSVEVSWARFGSVVAHFGLSCKRLALERLAHLAQLFRVFFILVSQVSCEPKFSP
jgi:hypothetical protein